MRTRKKHRRRGMPAVVQPHPLSAFELTARMDAFYVACVTVATRLVVAPANDAVPAIHVGSPAA